MATCYVCFNEIEAIGCAVGTTFVGDRGQHRRMYAHQECDERVAKAEVAAMTADPDFAGFGLDGFPID